MTISIKLKLMVMPCYVLVDPIRLLYSKESGTSKILICFDQLKGWVSTVFVIGSNPMVGGLDQ